MPHPCQVVLVGALQLGHRVSLSRLSSSLFLSWSGGKNWVAHSQLRHLTSQYFQRKLMCPPSFCTSSDSRALHVGHNRGRPSCPCRGRPRREGQSCTGLLVWSFLLLLVTGALLAVAPGDTAFTLATLFHDGTCSSMTSNILERRSATGRIACVSHFSHLPARFTNVG